jgi:hypothetical protein
MKEKPADTCALGVELDDVVRQCPIVQVGEEPDSARSAGARRKVVDRVPLDLLPHPQRAEVRLPVLHHGRQRYRLAVRRLE